MLHRLRTSRRAAALWVVWFALAWLVAARPHVPQFSDTEFICSGGELVAVAGTDHGTSGTAAHDASCGFCSSATAGPLPSPWALPLAVALVPGYIVQGVPADRFAEAGPSGPPRGPPASAHGLS